MKLIEQYIAFNHFGRELGMHFEIKQPGIVHHYLTITEKHLATPNVSHGGVIAAFMDAIIGVAAMSTVVQEGKIVSTVEFKINYLAPALLHDQLIGIGKVEQQGSRLIIATGDIFCANRNNIVIAKSMGTFNAYPFEKTGFKLPE